MIGVRSIRASAGNEVGKDGWGDEVVKDVLVCC